ncbi:MAG: glycosyltransferase family 4 protein [Gammaproteobacteria bacterium]|nr:glycosyltransferase family 4 protein [Gammaproteobacteria bacterium]
MNLYFDSDVFRDAPAGIFRYAKEIAARFIADSTVDCKFVSGRGLGAAGFLPSLHALFSEDVEFYEKYSFQKGDSLSYFVRKYRDQFRLARLEDADKHVLAHKFRREMLRFLYQRETRELAKKNCRFHFDGDAPVLFGPRRSLSAFSCVNKPPMRVQVVHDLIAKIHPEYFDSTEFVEEVFDDLDQNQIIIADSEHTRKDLLRLAPHIDPVKVHSVLISCSDHFVPVTSSVEIARVKERYGIPQESDYVLSLCTVEPRKNHVRLLKAWGNIYERMQLNNPKLVIAGRKGWGADFQRELEGRAAQENSVILTGFVDDADLPALYSGSVCTAYPSMYEGFGLPVLESMKCGRFCVTSNVSSMPEVIGTDVPLVDPLSVESIADLLLRVVNDAPLRRSLEDVVRRRAQEFSWEKTYSRTKSLILNAVAEMK